MACYRCRRYDWAHVIFFAAKLLVLYVRLHYALLPLENDLATGSNSPHCLEGRKCLQIQVLDSTELRKHEDKSPNDNRFVHINERNTIQHFEARRFSSRRLTVCICSYAQHNEAHSQKSAGNICTSSNVHRKTSPIHHVEHWLLTLWWPPLVPQGIATCPSFAMTRPAEKLYFERTSRKNVFPTRCQCYVSWEVQAVTNVACLSSCCSYHKQCMLEDMHPLVAFRDILLQGIGMQYCRLMTAMFCFKPGRSTQLPMLHPQNHLALYSPVNHYCHRHALTGLHQFYCRAKRNTS